MQKDEMEKGTAVSGCDEVDYCGDRDVVECHRSNDHDHSNAYTAWLAMGSPEQALPHLRASVGALDDPEATPAIVTLCVVGTQMGASDLEPVCAEAARRGAPPPPFGHLPLASEGEGRAPTAR